MLNHVTNIVYAKDSVLKSIINKDGNIDFNLVTPFTGEFRWNGIRSDAETAAEVVTGKPISSNPLIASLEMSRRSRVDVTKMDDEGFEQFIQMLKNKRSCGFLHSVDFARSEWGTKWNTYSQELRIDDGFIKFDTAWSCPVKALCALSAKNKKPSDDGFFVVSKKSVTRAGQRQHRRRRSMKHQQFVVLGEIHAEIPGHDIVRTQVFMHDDTTHPIHAVGHAPRRITQVAAQAFASARSELTHDAGQAFGPVTGAESAPGLGDAQDIDFF